jgi:putative endonuclease
MASQRNGTLYIGVTNNLQRRVYEHKNNITRGFTQKYKVHNLVYYEVFDDIKEAIRGITARFLDPRFGGDDK